jgi:WD40 repeat protein
VRSLAFSGIDRLFGADNEGVIRSWVIGDDGKLTEGDPMDHGLESEKVVPRGEGSEERGAYALAISPCHGYLACSGRGMHRAISIWKVGASASLVNVLYCPRHGSLRGTHSLGFIRDTPHLWSANWDGSIVRWDWSKPGGHRVLYQPEPHMSVMTASESGDELVLGTALGEVYGLNLMDIQNALGKHRP